MSSSAGDTLLTLGHSNHSYEHFQRLLTEHGVEVLVDVRSWPHSRYVDWVDRSTLPGVARSVGVKYLFLGDKLGGRPDDPSSYDDEGHVLYGKVAAGKQFQDGLERLRKGIARCRVAIMCSEEDPRDCHRRLLVAKVLLEEGVTVTHIRGNGSTETEPGRIDLSEGSLFEEEERVWRSSRSVLRKRPPRTSLAA